MLTVASWGNQLCVPIWIKSGLLVYRVDLGLKWTNGIRPQWVRYYELIWAKYMGPHRDRSGINGHGLTEKLNVCFKTCKMLQN